MINTINYNVPGAFGGLDLHGKSRRVTWTRLLSGVAAGASVVRVGSPVDWEVGEEVVLTTTSHKAKETEVRTIAALSGDKTTITLDSPLLYSHTGDLTTTKYLHLNVEADGEIKLYTCNNPLVRKENKGSCMSIHVQCLRRQ